MRIEILMSPGCRHGAEAFALVSEIVRASAPDAEVVTTLVGTSEDAERCGFPGSPTIRVNDRDIDPNAPTDVGLG